MFVPRLWHWSYTALVTLIDIGRKCEIVFCRWASWWASEQLWSSPLAWSGPPSSSWGQTPVFRLSFKTILFRQTTGAIFVLIANLERLLVLLAGTVNCIAFHEFEIVVILWGPVTVFNAVFLSEFRSSFKICNTAANFFYHLANCGKRLLLYIIICFC